MIVSTIGFLLLFVQGLVAWAEGSSLFDNVRNLQRTIQEMATEGHEILREELHDSMIVKEGVRQLQPANEGGMIMPVGGEPAEEVGFEGEGDMMVCEAWGESNEAMFPFVFNCMTNLAAFFVGEDMDVQVLQAFCDESDSTSCISDLNNLVTSAEENGSDNCTTQAADMNNMRSVCLQEDGVFCFSQLTHLAAIEDGDIDEMPSSDVVCHPCYGSIMSFAASSANETEMAEYDTMMFAFSQACIEDENGNNCMDLIATTMADMDNNADTTGEDPPCSFFDEQLDDTTTVDTAANVARNRANACSESCRTYLSDMLDSLGCCAYPFVSMDTLMGGEASVTVMDYITETCGLHVPPACGSPPIIVDETPATSTNDNNVPPQTAVTPPEAGGTTDEVAPVTSSDTDPAINEQASESNETEEIEATGESNDADENETSNDTDEATNGIADEASHANVPTNHKILYPLIAAISAWLTSATMI